VALYVRPLVLLFLLDAMCFTILQCETLCWDFQQELGTRIRELELGVADRRNQRQEREAVLSQKRARRDQCVGRFLIHTLHDSTQLGWVCEGKGLAL
jgi:hypothetical protein